MMEPVDQEVYDQFFTLGVPHERDLLFDQNLFNTGINSIQFLGKVQNMPSSMAFDG